MKYKLLKDLPGCKLGQIFIVENDDLIKFDGEDNNYFTPNTHSYLFYLVRSYRNDPEWFEPVQPIESDPLREKVEIKLLWLTHGLSPNEEKQLLDCVIKLIKEGGSNE